jgi:ABC-type sugar transport system permease subunit
VAVAAPRAAESRRARRKGRAGSGGPRYPGWLALPAVFWYLLFFLGPLAIMASYSFGELSGYTDVKLVWNLENYRYLFDGTLYTDVFKRTFVMASIGRWPRWRSDFRSRTTWRGTRNTRRCCSCS